MLKEFAVDAPALSRNPRTPSLSAAPRGFARSPAPRSLRVLRTGGFRGRALIREHHRLFALFGKGGRQSRPCIARGQAGRAAHCTKARRRNRERRLLIRA